MATLVTDRLAERLVAIEVIAQHGDPPRGIARAPPRQPTAGGRQFTVLFVVAILGANELGRQRHYSRRPWRHDHRRQDDRVMLGGAVAEGPLIAAVTPQLLRREILGAIEGHEQGIEDRPERFR